jgi:Holliday junction resolvasome RuvABC endonuclease subunit
MSILKIAAIDPSLSNFGLVRGTVDISHEAFPVELSELTLVETDTDKSSRKVVRRNSEDLERARKLLRGMHRFIADADMVFVEVPVGSQSARAMASYGVCIGILASIGKPLIQVTPTEVKLAAVGTKTASKNEMIEWASGLYPNLNWLMSRGKMTAKNEHLADAIGAIHAGLLTDEFARAASVFHVMNAKEAV